MTPEHCSSSERSMTRERHAARRSHPSCSSLSAPTPCWEWVPMPSCMAALSATTQSVALRLSQRQRLRAARKVGGARVHRGRARVRDHKRAQLAVLEPARELRHHGLAVHRRGLHRVGQREVQEGGVRHHRDLALRPCRQPCQEARPARTDVLLALTHVRHPPAVLLRLDEREVDGGELLPVVRHGPPPVARVHAQVLPAQLVRQEGRRALR
mmetsp:Transcript_15598/g.38821  ORF Transcript_15598/g.38821 Transcript_15598/m.38821 type:complete len:212 (+) Transcript_15598:27-662(+)